MSVRTDTIAPSPNDQDLASQLFDQPVIVTDSETTGYPFPPDPADPLQTSPATIADQPTSAGPSLTTGSVTKTPSPSRGGALPPKNPVHLIASTLLDHTHIPQSHHLELAEEILNTGKLSPTARVSEISKLLDNRAPEYIVKDLASLAGAAYGRPDSQTIAQATQIATQDPDQIPTSEGADVPTNNLYVAVSSQLQQSTGLSPQQVHPETQVLSIHKILNPVVPAKDHAQLIQSLAPSLEAKSHRPLAVDPQPLADHLHSFNLQAAGDELIKQTIQVQAIRAGLTAQDAAQFASAALPNVKFSYFLSGYASENPSPQKPDAAQKDAFLRFRSANLDRITSQLVAANPAFAQKLKDFQLARFSFEPVRQSMAEVYGAPQSMATPDTPEFTRYLSELGDGPEKWLPTPVRFVLKRFVASYIGIKIVNSKLGRELGLRELSARIGYSIPLKYRPLGAFSKIPQRGYIQGMRVANRWFQMQNNLNPYFGPLYRQLSASGVATRQSFKKLGQAGVAQLSKSAAGKAIVGVGTKIAAQAGVQTLLQALGTTVPVIGNIAAWIIGELILKVLGKIWDRVKGTVKAMGEALLGLTAGLTAFAVSGSLAIGVGAGVGTWGLASFFNNSQALSQVGQTANNVLTALTLAGATSIGMGVIIATLSVPIVIAFFLYIINSSAYIVPPTRVTFGSGGPIIIPGAGGPPTGPLPPGCPRIWPVASGRITQGAWVSPSFNPGTYHNDEEALDIGSVPVGTEVRATHPGVVINKTMSGCGYGNFVDVYSTCNYNGQTLRIFTRYAHLSSYAVPDNTSVAEGDLIAYSGASGCYPAHLHYEMGLDNGTLFGLNTHYEANIAPFMWPNFIPLAGNPPRPVPRGCVMGPTSNPSIDTCNITIP